MQPINYMQGYKDPFENILGQVQAYQTFSQNANTLRSQKAQSELEKATSDRKIRAMQDLQNVDYNNIHALREQAMRYADLEYSKGVQAHLAQFDEKQKQAEIGRVSQTLSLLKNGKNDVAIDDLLAQAQAYENAGDSQNAQGARQMAELIRQSPQSALHQAQRLFGMMVPKEQMESYAKMIEAEKQAVNYHDLGNQVMASLIDPITGQMTTQNVGFKGQSPDNLADNKRALEVAQMGYESAENVANINNAGAMERTQYTTQADLAKAQAQIDANTQAKLIEIEHQKQQNKFKNAMQLRDENGDMFYYDPITGHSEYAIDPNGQKVKWQGNGANAKSLTDTQSNAFTFGSRMLNSNTILSDLESKGVRLNLGQLFTDDDSFLLTKAVVNAFSSPEQQQYAQALRDFINATLRKESGAAIGKTEFLNAQKQYFPMPGDSPQVIAQKAKNRRIAMYGILAGVPNDFLLSQGIDLNAIKDDETNKPKSYQDMELPR